MIEKARRNALPLRLANGRVAPQHDTMSTPALADTGEWVGIYDVFSVDERMKAIQDDAWFER